jgi:hypothetical protein
VTLIIWTIISLIIAAMVIGAYLLLRNQMRVTPGPGTRPPGRRWPTSARREPSVERRDDTQPPNAPN